MARASHKAREILRRLRDSEWMREGSAAVTHYSLYFAVLSASVIRDFSRRS